MTEDSGMTDADTDADTGTGAERTFTKAELARAVNAAVRSKVAEVRGEYADYDKLKAAAAEGDKSKTQLEKVSEQLAALTARAEKAEAAQLRASVIADKKIPASLAKRLQGSTEEELRADADELLADWKAAGGKSDDDAGGEGEADAPEARPVSRGRPREDLRSGAPVTAREPEETNPLKLAALIPRG
jgi:hypothetical protein